MERRIYLWGDSISKGVVLDRETGGYRVAKRRCTALLRADGLDLEPHACMGATIRVGYAHFSGAKTVPGSVAVIQFGGNDCDLDWDAVEARPDLFHDGRVPLAEYTSLLELFIRSARERQLSPVVAVPPPLHAERFFRWVTRNRGAEAILRYLRDVQHIYRWQERYVRAAEETARRLDCPLVDLREPFLSAPDFSALMCMDGIHPNEAGQELMARAVMTSIGEGRLTA